MAHAHQAWLSGHHSSVRRQKEQETLCMCGERERKRARHRTWRTVRHGMCISPWGEPVTCVQS